MYFAKPSAKCTPDNNKDLPIIMIGPNEIDKVSETKFLGVIIDENLSWDAHIKALAKKLASCTGCLNQIVASIPESLYIELYHTLFESYLSYGITVWGSTSDTKLNKLFVAHKKVVRILFGDREKFINKFKTSVRTRPYSCQKLTAEFYTKEHSKPLFNKNKILSLKNLYFYHSLNEFFKILKFKSPHVLFNQLIISNCTSKELLISTPRQNDTYLSRSSILWNKCIKFIFSKPSLTEICHSHMKKPEKIIIPGSSPNSDLCCSITIFKHRLKELLFEIQMQGDALEWKPINFELPHNAKNLNLKWLVE